MGASVRTGVLALALPSMLVLVAASPGCGREEPAPTRAEPTGVGQTPPAADATPDSASADARGAAPVPPPPRLPRGLVAREEGVTPGYVLFNPLLSDTAYLVDNDGRVVHRWRSAYSPGGGMVLLPDGHLLRTGRDPALGAFRAGGTGGILQKLDWDGNVVWEWRLSGEEAVQHHDVEPLPDGNILVLAWEVKSPEECRRAGRRVDRIPEQGLWPDWLLEIEPVPPDGARVVWEWHVWDHLVQDQDPTAPHYGDPAAHPGRLDVNAGTGEPAIDPVQLEQLKALGYVPEDARPQDLESDFLHVNAVAYHPRLDQIALSIPTLGEIWILDHGTTTEEAAGPAGDLLYRFGNPGAYRRGTGPDRRGGKRFFYQHDVRWIPDGWEGAGNLTVFNNGLERPAGAWSSVDEWTPPLAAGGRYRLEDGRPFGPDALAWEYTAPEPTDLFAPFISGAHRLRNGNTLVCDGTDGRFLEVTRDGRTVWEYRNPFSGTARMADGSMPQPGLEQSPYAIFRATRIPADHPALAGRALAPLDPQPAWHAWAPPAPGEAGGGS